MASEEEPVVEQAAEEEKLPDSEKGAQEGEGNQPKEPDFCLESIPVDYELVK